MPRSYLFRLWLRGKSLSYAAAAERCLKLGQPISAKYLEHIATEWARASGSLSLFLSRDLTLGEVTVEYFLSVEPKRKAA